jgi:hypothetical protein
MLHLLEARLPRDCARGRARACPAVLYTCHFGILTMLFSHLIYETDYS